MRETWTDFRGREWRVVASLRRLKFRYPSHAALRAHVFNRDGFTCVRCGAKGQQDEGAEYSGRNTLYTNTLLRTRGHDVLVLDHILSLRAGGTNHPSNFQTLCETCNKRKQKQDKADALKLRGGV